VTSLPTASTLPAKSCPMTVPLWPDGPGEESREEGFARPEAAIRPVHSRRVNLDEQLVVLGRRLFSLLISGPLPADRIWCELLPSWVHCSKSPKVDFGSHSRRPAQDDSPRLVAHLAIRQSIDGATGRFRGNLRSGATPVARLPEPGAYSRRFLPQGDLCAALATLSAVPNQVANERLL